MDLARFAHLLRSVGTFNKSVNKKWSRADIKRVPACSSQLLSVRAPFARLLSGRLDVPIAGWSIRGNLSPGTSSQAPGRRCHCGHDGVAVVGVGSLRRPMPRIPGMEFGCVAGWFRTASQLCMTQTKKSVNKKVDLFLRASAQEPSTRVSNKCFFPRASAQEPSTIVSTKSGCFPRASAQEPSTRTSTKSGPIWVYL